ncbi:MAG: hypothetical protein CMN30_02150 [Sandaracinus sp.]|nr:hypothetical protein [Sandaracinus sp.]
MALLLGCETVSLRPAPSEPTEPAAPVATETAAPATPPPGRVTALAVGPRSNCAILDEHELWCWGSGDDGLLGPHPGPGPVRLLTAEGLSAVSVGGASLCFVASGEVQCLGRPQAPPDLFTGYRHPGEARTAPEPVRGIDGVRAVAVGGEATCLLRDSGSVHCLGSPSAGGGPGASTRRTGAAIVQEARSLTASGAHACASTGDGSVWCWGSGHAGQLPGTEVRHSVEAVLLPGLADVRQVAAAPDGSLGCALAGRGSLTCWGAAGDVWRRRGAMLGEGLVQVPEVGEPIRRVRVGALEILTVAESGAVYRIAVTAPEQDPEGSTTTPLRARLERPRRLALPPAVDVGVGVAHRCALGTDRNVRCWGHRIGGRLGDGDSSDPRPVPAEEAVLVEFTEETAG